MMKHTILFSTPELKITKNLIWVTDLHLDATDFEQYEHLIELIAKHHPDMILVGGDIANGELALQYLEKLSHLFEIPILFVLGNHDYYFGSIQKMRVLAKELCQKRPHLEYLTDCGVIPLTETTAIIGHDGWADGRAGNFLHSDIILNDYLLIDELSGLHKEERLKILNTLGDEAAFEIKSKLQQALKEFDRVILLMHTPPFLEACYYGEHQSDENWSPHFVCKAVGQMLLEEIESFPNKELLILCGHTHTGVDVQLKKNIRILTGESRLGHPSIQGMVLTN